VVVRIRYGSNEIACDEDVLMEDEEQSGGWVVYKKCWNAEDSADITSFIVMTRSGKQLPFTSIDPSPSLTTRTNHHPPK
jgi:hypothetical protein